jgi:hypothetical protein
MIETHLFILPLIQLCRTCLFGTRDHSALALSPWPYNLSLPFCSASETAAPQSWSIAGRTWGAARHSGSSLNSSTYSISPRITRHPAHCTKSEYFSQTFKLLLLKFQNVAHPEGEEANLSCEENSFSLQMAQWYTPSSLNYHLIVGCFSIHRRTAQCTVVPCLARAWASVWKVSSTYALCRRS